MEMQYENAMQKYGLELKDLPEDAQIGIEQIKDVQSMIRINEKKGVKIKDKTLKKLKAMDKWVYYEILDLVEETEENEEEIPYTTEEVAEEIEEAQEESQQEDTEEETDEEEEVDAEVEKVSSNTKIGMDIDVDLEKAFESGKTEFTLDELKNISRTAYNVIFENYDDTGDNGIITSHFTLLETDEYQFTLTKN